MSFRDLRSDAWSLDELGATIQAGRLSAHCVLPSRLSTDQGRGAIVDKTLVKDPGRAVTHTALGSGLAHRISPHAVVTRAADLA